jgi:prepilin-type processing-associated H-X9-DG protein
VELLAVLGALALLGLVTLPALANTKSRSQRVGCVSNLSQIGRAFNQWATDHGDRYSFQVESAVGGTRHHPSGLQDNLWFQYAWISNELVTPRILVCPSDVTKQISLEWSGNPPNGFWNAGHQDNSISFSLLHPFAEDGRGALCADRSLKVAGLSSGCGYLGSIGIIDGATTAWLSRTDYGHGDSGNVLFNDGSVDELDSGGVRRALADYRPIDDRHIHAKFPGRAQ